ncbi:hypothetical protein vseg_016116 [Gypsophila vaccaria]
MAKVQRSGQAAVASAFLDYYSHLLDSSSSVTHFPSIPGPSIASDIALGLTQQFSALEIKVALFSIDRNKSPGPDGFTSGFYQDTWPIVGSDLCKAVQSFFSSGKMLKQVNSTLLTLVPKGPHASSVLDYRPIACCNTIYKVISKCLVARLQNVLPSIVGMEQAAFIKGRDIFDNIHMACELARKYNRKGIFPRAMFKVDIRKAFDSVNWVFLKDALLYYGFPPIFTNWIMQCVSTAHFSLNINGQMRGYFPGRRGLRQGDPLSPYLFVLCIEFLSRMLRLLPCGGYNFHPKCKRIGLSHLVFADDLLIFLKGDAQSAKAVADCLQHFANYSGLVVNPHKTNAYFGGINDVEQHHILTLTGFALGALPFKYLGLPLHASRLTAPLFQELVATIKSRLQHWSNHWLSYSGRVQLLNSVIMGIQTF